MVSDEGSTAATPAGWGTVVPHRRPAGWVAGSQLGIAAPRPSGGGRRGGPARKRPRSGSRPQLRLVRADDVVGDVRATGSHLRVARAVTAAVLLAVVVTSVLLAVLLRGSPAVSRAGEHGRASVQLLAPVPVRSLGHAVIRL